MSETRIVLTIGDHSSERTLEETMATFTKQAHLEPIIRAALERGETYEGAGWSIAPAPSWSIAGDQERLAREAREGRFTSGAIHGNGLDWRSVLGAVALVAAGFVGGLLVSWGWG